MGAYIGCYLGLLALKAIDSGEVVTPFMQDGTYVISNAVDASLLDAVFS